MTKKEILIRQINKILREIGVVSMKLRQGDNSTELLNKLERLMAHAETLKEQAKNLLK